MRLRLPTGFTRATLAGGLSCLVLTAAGWGLALERIAYERSQAVDEAVRHNTNLALAFEKHVVSTVKGLERVLGFLAYQYRSNGFAPGKFYVPDETGELTLLAAAGVVDQAGEIVFSMQGLRRASVADRDFFDYHRSSRDTSVRIGKPLVTRLEGRPVIPVTRRIELADGGFGGFVFAGIDPEYFTSFYNHVDLGPGGIAVLVGLDGIIRARREGVSLTAGEDVRGSSLYEHLARDRSGALLTGGRLDGVPRYLSYRTVRGYPLAVAVGATEEHVFAEFRARERNYLLAASSGTVLILLFGAGLWGFQRQHALAAAEANRSQARYRATFDEAAVGITHTSLDGRFIRVNRKFCEMLGYPEAELVGAAVDLITHPEDRALVAAQRTRMLYAGDAPPVEKRNLRKDGGVIWVAVSAALVRDPAGAADYLVAMVQDITERRRAEAALQHQAYHDSLTGLPNRALFYDRLEQAVRHARRRKTTVAALALDLDRFKLVNDSLGHALGDRLLQEVASRLAACVRSGDTVARVGGDGFALLLADMARAQDASIVGGKVVEALARPFDVEGHEVFLTASAGIAAFPCDGSDGAALVRNADAAMSRAKELGRNNYQFYTAEMNERATEKLLLQNDLRRALERGEFLLHYQPKASLASGRITGFEALLRWQHPRRGLVSPAQFVPLLEDSGLIVPVGEWVVRTACGQIAAWRDAGLEPLPVAVNLSAKQFHHRDIAAVVDAALAEHAVDPRLLDLEITESDVMRNPEEAAAVLRKLRERRVRIGIDDFGTGYSSLSYLKRLPVESLKIDRSFVSGLPADADDASIARAVITMAHSLGLRVVAEGVENDAQRHFLAAHECDEMQGYLLSRPQAAAEAARFLQQVPPRERA